MSEITIYKKPLLAVLEQEKKLRDFPEEERLFKCKQIIGNLLFDLGVSKKSEVEHHLRAISYLNKECGKYSVAEIEKAFTLAISGKLEMDLFQQVNVLVIGKVLSAYDNYKKEKLKIYRLAERQKKEMLPPMTKKEEIFYRNQAVNKQIEFFQDNRFVDATRVFVYDIFDKMGLMPIDLEYKKSVKKDAIEILKFEFSNKKATNKDEFNKIKKTLKNLNKGNCEGLIAKCKELALEDFLRKITAEEKLLKELKSKFSD